MKLLLILAALVVSVINHGDIPAEGMDLIVNQATYDPLSGTNVMAVEGTLLCQVPLTVTITRSVAGLSDELCCAGACTRGNGQTTETLNFVPGGMASWFIHYNPAPYSDVHISYLFSDGSDTRELRVHYIYPAEGIEITNHKSQITNRKILQDGHIYIVHNNQKYQIL